MAVVGVERSFATGNGESWLADLYQAHFGAVFRVCRSFLWDREGAADAAHDVFARAAHGGVPLENGDHTRAWLLLVARNHCIDQLRRDRRRDRALATVGSSSAEAADPEHVIVNRNLVKAVFAELSPRDRRLLWHSAVERRTLGEIATELRLSYVGAAQAVRRARLRAAAIAAKVAALLTLLRHRRATVLLSSANRALLLAIAPAVALTIQSSVQAQPTARAAVPNVAHRVVRSAAMPSSAMVGPSSTTPSTPAAQVTPSSFLPGAPPVANELTTVLGGLPQTTDTRARDLDRAVQAVIDRIPSGTSPITVPPAEIAPSAITRLR